MATDVFGALETAVFIVSMTVACRLYARKLPRRDRFAQRLAALAAVLAAAVAVAYLAGFSLHPPLSDNRSFFVATASFLAVVALATGSLWWLRDAPPLTAAFCASSAYVMQNLSSSLNRALHVSGVIASSYGNVTAMVATQVASTALVFAIVYRLLLHNLNARALMHVDDGLMLAMVILATLFNIFFELTISDLSVFDGLPHRYVAILSLTHLAICVVLLYGEFELIYSRHLREDVAAMRDVIEQNERQYQASQRSFEAVNGRVHDIRHAVARILAAGDSGVTTRELADVLRQISVYDTTVRTGNVTLDAVLTERRLLCQQRGITLTCIADGHALDFLPAADVYALVGTALDEMVAFLDRRGSHGGSATFIARQKLGVTSLHLEAAIGGAGPDDCPVSPQALRTMSCVIDRHEGTLTVDRSTEGLMLDVLLHEPDPRV